jgi:hypothetical protein
MSAGLAAAGYPDFLCAILTVTACAAFIKESRMKLVRPAGLSRKSGGFTRSFASGFDQINPVMLSGGLILINSDQFSEV